MIRISSLLKSLSHHRLLDDGIIPELFRNESVPTKNPPPSTTTEKNPSHFGLFIDHLFINMYLANHQGSHSGAIPIENYYTRPWKEIYLPLHEYVCGLYSTTHIPERVEKIRTYFMGMEKFVNSITLDHFVFETEERFDNILCHPDIVHGDTIYDIKTTRNLFGDQMYPHVCLQLLSYATLYRAMGKTVNSVGVVLPMQRMIVKQDISSWDSSSFLIEIIQAYQRVSTTPTLNDLSVIHNARTNLIGFHTQKKKTVLQTIEEMSDGISGVAIQIFLRPPRQFRGGVGAFNKDIATKARRLCREKNLRLYIHSPYVINLCRESTEIDTIKDDLVKGRYLKSRGVVFHVGKRTFKDSKTSESMKDIPLSVCLDTMETKIHQLLEFASERTALCIETPAKQGKKDGGSEFGEVLSDIGSMIDFYNRFSEEEKRKFKICVDTCHVFSAGYQPMDYITKLHEACPEAIRLIHYNGSSVPLGACNDCHAPICGGYIQLGKSIGQGIVLDTEHIGVSEMARVAQWCIDNHVDGVVE